MGISDREHRQFPSRAALRSWLVEHAGSSPGIWVVLPRARSGGSGPSYDDLPPSARQQHLWFVISAKRPETRARRVAAVASAAAGGRRAVG